MSYLYSSDRSEKHSPHQYKKRTAKKNVGERKKICVIDDDPDIAFALRLSLQLEGFEVVTPEETSTKSIAQSRPDLILLDVLMPERDGRDIAREMKKNKETQHIPIVLISALSNVGKIAHDVGADDFLKKPFPMTTLMATVKNTLREKENIN